MNAGRRPFCLVLALWGSRYGAAHVNEIARAAFDTSPSLAEVVLVTDRRRDGIDERVRQVPFPPPFDGPRFFGWGYRAKLAVFSPEVLPPGLPCVFLDLDTVVVGDLGRIAALVTRPDDILMMPPAGLGFGPLRRLIDRLRGGRGFPVGNSSMLAFHSGASPNLADTFARRHATGEGAGERHMQIDDVFVSWFGRGRLSGIPADCGVMFRREFLSRVPGYPALKARLPWVRRRRARLAAVTMNGVALKPEILATMPDGAALSDGRGRRGRWDAACLGLLLPKIREASRRIAAAQGAESERGTENDETRRE